MSSSSETVVLGFVEFVRSYERGGGSRQRWSEERRSQDLEWWPDLKSEVRVKSERWDTWGEWKFQKPKGNFRGFLFFPLSPTITLLKECYRNYTYYSAHTKSAIKWLWNKTFTIYNSTSDTKVLL
jgi:hypothetical protein